MKHLIKILLIVSAGLLFGKCTNNASRIIGVKIYEYDGSYSVLCSKWEKMGINTAFISKNMAANRTFRDALKKSNIKAFIIFPVFQNPEVLGKDSSLYSITSKGTKAKDDWVEFVCPSRISYRNSKVDEMTDLINNLHPDGISLDFIRQFVFWEMIYPDRESGSIESACFCDSCLSGFLNQKGLMLPDTCLTTKQKADYILINYEHAWEIYRSNLITTMVKVLADKSRLIKPDLKVNVHIVPWREGDFDGANIRIASQDLKTISPYADYVSPMCYSQMLKRDAGWIAGVVEDMDKRAAGKVLPSIQVYPYYIDSDFTTEDFKQCLEQALKSPSLGVIFFSWPLFEKDSSRMDVVREVVTGGL